MRPPSTPQRCSASAGFDRIFISYSLSMIPDWEQTDSAGARRPQAGRLAAHRRFRPAGAPAALVPQPAARLARELPCHPARNAAARSSGIGSPRASAQASVSKRFIAVTPGSRRDRAAADDLAAHGPDQAPHTMRSAAGSRAWPASAPAAPPPAGSDGTIAIVWPSWPFIQKVSAGRSKPASGSWPSGVASRAVQPHLALAVVPFDAGAACASRPPSRPAGVPGRSRLPSCSRNSPKRAQSRAGGVQVGRADEGAARVGLHHRAAHAERLEQRLRAARPAPRRSPTASCHSRASSTLRAAGIVEERADRLRQRLGFARRPPCRAPDRACA